MGTKSFLDELVSTKDEGKAVANKSFLDELVGQKPIEKSKEEQKESADYKNIYFNGVPIRQYTNDKEEKTIPVNTVTINGAEFPTMQSITPEKGHEILSKPAPAVKYTGSVGEQLLATFASNAAEALVNVPTFGLLKYLGAPSVATTPQGITGEVPTGIAGQLAGSVPGLGIIGRGFHLATQAIVKGLPKGIATMVEAGIKVGFTYDMLSSALSNSVEFKTAFFSGDTKGMINSGSSVLIDTLFATFLAKGLTTDAKQLADFKTHLQQQQQLGLPRDLAIQSWGEFKGLPSNELLVKADKTAYEGQLKNDIKEVNKKVHTKNVQTKKLKEVDYQPFSEEEFNKVIEKGKIETDLIKDWSEYSRVKKMDFSDRINSIDLNTGVKSPETLTSENSPFRTTGDVTESQRINYEKSPIVAKSFSEFSDPNPEIYKSALVTAHKLVNDFNLHLDGKAVDIEASKDLASRIAANPEEFKWQFVEENGQVDEVAFGEFSQYASDAAEWMRKTSTKTEVIDYTTKIHEAPEGYVRLYRGHKGEFTPLSDTIDLSQSMERGRWFTTDIEAAKFYGDIYYVDVPKGIAEASIVPDSLYNKTGRLISTEWANKSKKLSINDDKGFSLYSGIPVDKLIEVGKGILNYRKKLEAAKKVPLGDKLKRAKEVGIAQWLNQSGNAKALIESKGDAAYEVLQATALARGGHPRAVNEFKQAKKEYRSGLSREEKHMQDDLILAMTVKDIAAGGKGEKVSYPEGFSPEQSEVIIQGIGSKHVNRLKDLSPQEELLLRKSTDAYFESWKRTVDDMFEEGLIGKAEQDALKSRNYSRMTPAKIPTFEALLDKVYEVPGKSGKYVSDSGIESMKVGGGTTLFEINSELKMLEAKDRAYNRIMTNKAKKSMADFARNRPSNSFARIDTAKIIELPKQPTTRTELQRSVKINRYENKVSDYEFEDLLKTKYKAKKLNQLTMEQLKEFDKELGTSKGYEKLFKPPKGWTTDHYYENGAEKTLWLEPKFASEWMTDTKELSGPFAKFVRIISGTQIVKMFATGINPAFAIANLPRDVMHAWFASRVMENGKWDSLYSMYVPNAIGEFAGDYKDVFTDVVHLETSSKFPFIKFTRTGRVNDFIEDGGGMNYLYSQGKLSEAGVKGNKVRLETPFDKVYEFMSYINESSELMTRLAIRERVIKRRASELGISVEQAAKDPKIRKEATYAAIDQMNFGEGGSFTKALDNAVPYLNARIVGTRSLFRVFEPGSGTAEQSAVKLAQFATLVTGLYLLNKKRNPQAMDDLKDDPRGIRSLTIPFGKDSGVDVEGSTRFPFIKVPLDSSQAFFKVLFEGLAEKMTGGEVDPTRIVKSLKENLPADITSLPPTLQALVGYYTNTNIWTGEEIWKSMQGTISYKGPQWLTGDKVGGSELERRPGQTPNIYGDLGTATGMSPERLKYMMESYLTSDNVFAQMTFSAYDKIFHNLPEDQRKMLLTEAMSKTGGIKRFYGLTSPAAKDVREAKDINQDRIAIRLEQDTKFDDLVNGYLFRKDTKYTDIARFINKQKDPLDKDRLWDEFDFSKATKGLPNRTWWMTLKRMDVEGKAEAWIKRYRHAQVIDEKEGNRKQVNQLNKETQRFGAESGQIKGVVSDEFWERVSLLRRKK